MSRLPDLTPETMTEAQRAIHDKIVSGPRGSISGPFLAWLHSPELADRAQHLGEYARFDSALPTELSELAILVTAHHWRAQFEWWIHAQTAEDAGLHPAIIAAVHAGEDPPFTSDAQRAVYAFAREMYATTRVSAETYDDTVSHLGVEGTVDLVGVLGYYALVSMTLNAFEMPVPEGEDPPFEG